MNGEQEKVYSEEMISAKAQAEVERTTREILGAWKRSVQNIIAVGAGLSRLQQLLPRQAYKGHLKRRLGLNEMQAWRFIAVHKRFGSSESSRVLQSKPSVLYLLAGASDIARVERLARGHRVKIGNKRKSIDELKVADALRLREPVKITHQREPSDDEVDHRRCAAAFRELGGLLLSVQDWASDLNRYARRGMEIPKRELVVATLKETWLAIDSTLKVLH